MRTVITLIFVVFYLTIMLPVQLITFILCKLAPKAGDKFAHSVASFGFVILEKISGSHITVIGHDRIPTDTPVLYIGNHRSFYDVIYTFHRSVGNIGYLSKIEFKKIPVLSWWMSMLHCEFVDRNDVKQGLKTILKCIDNVKGGCSMMIFPEGTRNHDEGTLMEFHEGSFKVATKSGCPIVPVTIGHSAQVLEDHYPWIRRADVIIEYGDPIYPDKLDAEDLKHIGAYTREIILKTLEKNN